jgi:hypothetical protein
MRQRHREAQTRLPWIEGPLVVGCTERANLILSCPIEGQLAAGGANPHASALWTLLFREQEPADGVGEPIEARAGGNRSVWNRYTSDRHALRLDHGRDTLGQRPGRRTDRRRLAVQPSVQEPARVGAQPRNRAQGLLRARQRLFPLLRGRQPLIAHQPQVPMRDPQGGPQIVNQLGKHAIGVVHGPGDWHVA